MNRFISINHLDLDMMNTVPVKRTHSPVHKSLAVSFATVFFKHNKIIRLTDIAANIYLAKAHNTTVIFHCTM
ncbi:MULTISPECIES: hypothetical protein [Huintestinicola]|uniref:hypothetical protein n=1 Tax=Huintestinicola sp. TaxID=2981661 RepID=UPI0021CFA078|nr:hypothetical protein [Huintestinicola butyrica]MCU6728374.1 hypothetical protein [Huintestinicola butyrica]